MNDIIKYLVFIWLVACALVAWVACAIFGFLFVFTEFSFMYHVTPFIGLSCGFCIIKCAFHVLLKSNPAAYFNHKVEQMKSLIGQRSI